MAQYRWKVDLRENRKQAVHFLTKEVGINRVFLEDVIEEVKQACAPVKQRHRGFSKKMATGRERRRAVELVEQLEYWQRRWSKAPPGTKQDANRIIQEEINPRRKELARLTRQYNFTRPGARSKLVARLLYGFSRLNQTNAGEKELRVHAIHGFAIMLYCDGLLKASEKSVRHATPAYQEVTRRIERFASGSFPGNVHYHLRSPLTMKAGPKGEAGGRRRRAVEVLSGPDPWDKQRTGLAGWPLRQRPIGCGRKPCPEVRFRGNQKQQILERIAYITNLRHSLLASPRVTATNMRRGVSPRRRRAR
jgi:hypothetical protein